MTLTIILLVLLAAGIIGYTRWTRYQAQKAKAARRKDYNALTTAEDKYIALETEDDPAEIRAMWATWRTRGWAEGGMLHIHVLDRLDYLKDDLSPAERAYLEDAPEKFRHGASLPPVRGQGGSR